MGRTFALADLHGHLDIYKQVKAFLQPEDKVIFLGDACDRGPHPWETLKAVYSDPQFIYLKGNHEEMFADAIEGDAYLSYINGGSGTLEGWSADGGYEEWAKRLRRLPIEYTYKNKSGRTIHLSHAGYTPGSYDTDLLWDRDHFYDKWKKGYEDWIIVHGHTPIPSLIYDFTGVYDEEGFEPKAYWYADHHKVDIDAGTFFEYCSILLDIDTFEEHIFETEVGR